VQDHDAEIRFDVTGATDGLAALKVTAPGARTVIDLKSPDSKLGVRSLTIESPEPDDDKIVRADFPAGAYRFEGTTTKGAGPARRGAVEPRLPRTGRVRISAAGPEGRTYHRSHLEMVGTEGDRGLRHRDRAKRLGVRNTRTCCQGSARSFAVPEGFLRAGKAYKFAIGTVAKDGNRSFIEGSFTTARAR
jgi:hypothetical protein